jgi:hypothetical protein
VVFEGRIMNKKRNTRVSNQACHIENTESIYRPHMLDFFLAYVTLHCTIDVVDFN